MTDAHAPSWFLGCDGGVGHYLWRSDSRRHLWPTEIEGFPWKNIDAGWGRTERQGAATLHHKDGWTVLSVTDNTIDRRPGSHATFVFHDADLTFGEAIERATADFPHIVKRVGTITEVEAHVRRR